MEEKLESVYLSLKLKTLHRRFDGTLSGLVALSTIFELLHNLYGFIECNHWARNWYIHNIKSIKEGKTIIELFRNLSF